MRQVRNLLIAIVVLAGVGYASVYAYMYTKVKSAVDRAALGLMVAGDFKYSGVSVSPISSAVGVDGIRFTPNNFNDPIRIDSAQFQLDNLVDWMQLSDGFSPNMEFPQHGEVRLAGVHIPLDADWLRDLADPALASLRKQKYAPKLCGGNWFIGPAEMKEMGFDEFIADFSAHFSHSTNLGRMNQVIDVTVHDMMQLRFKAVNSAPHDSRLISFARMQEPKLLDTRLTYTDLGYAQKEIEYCAKASGMSVADYIEARVNQPDRDYAVTWGIVPGQAIRAAYRRYLIKPGDISFAVDPVESFSLRTLHLYKPEDMPAILGLRVSVNDQPIGDLAFKPADKSMFDDEDPGATRYSVTASLGELGSKFQKKEQPNRTTTTTAAPKKVEKPHFRVVTLDGIREHLGHRIKVHVAGGLVREGTLERVADSKLFVVRNVHGGKFTVPVPYAKVAKIEVFY
jgi:hypothetical protein